MNKYANIGTQMKNKFLDDTTSEQTENNNPTQ